MPRRRMTARNRRDFRAIPNVRSDPPSSIDLSDFDALLVDLDGVMTRTEVVHARAWKRLFDEFLAVHAGCEKKPLEPFDVQKDYRQYVDGKPRYDGVKSFLDARGISLPYGTPKDDPARETICGLGNRKNRYFLEQLREHGVEVYESSVAFIREAKSGGLKTAVVSASENCSAVLEAAGLADLFDVQVDGVEAGRLGLSGKPAPDTFLEAAKRIGVAPERAVLIEDALAGVEAGRRGGFGCVIGVDRADQADALRKHGADLVVQDLGVIHIGSKRRHTGKTKEALPSALDHLKEIACQLEGKRFAVFLDYDGTVTPIVDRPEHALLSEAMRQTLRNLARQCTVAVISGRDRSDVIRLVGLEGLFYAGSHGFDISGPNDFRMQHQEGLSHAPDLRRAEEELRRALIEVDGVIVEGKEFAVAVHYRLVAERNLPTVRETVDAIASRYPRLQKTGGKKILELRPRLDWDKGKTVLWLLKALHLNSPEVLSLYLGDDLTDEDAFAALKGRGIGILVADRLHPTKASYLLHNPDEVKFFLEQLIAILRGTCP